MTASKDEIQIVNITAEIAKLSAEGKKKGQIHGSLFNLIIYSQDPQRSLFLKDIIQTTTETFPCRIILISCDRQATKDFLKVDVEEEIIKKNGTVIACDKINIQCSTKYLNRVPSIVLPHFVPDLPIFLLWGLDPSEENELLPFFQTLAARLIFDPETSCDIQAFSKKMLSDPALNKIPVTDMNWASLTSWREIFYQVFDTQEKIELLCHCKKIKILYNNKMNYQHPERRAIYLQGWLAAQLGWQYTQAKVQNGTIQISYKNKQNDHVVDIIGNEISDLPTGAIVEVEVHTENEKIFNLSRMSTQPFIKAHIMTKDTCDLPLTFPLRHSKKGLIFMNEIFFSPCSSHYWNMLKVIEHIQVPC